MPPSWRMLVKVSRFLSPVRYRSLDGRSGSSRIKEARVVALPDNAPRTSNAVRPKFT